MFGFISTYATDVFFSDQWDFDDATVFQRHNLWQMFTWQHGPHRQGLGAILGWLVEPWFSWDSRVESFMVGGIIVAACALALWLKHKLFGEFSYSDAIIPMILFTPLQAESLFITANLAHGPLPLLLILSYCLAWTITAARPRYILVVLLNFVTVYTGFGLFLGVLTPFLLAIDYRFRVQDKAAARTLFWASLVLSVASLGSFFIGYTMQPAIDCFSFRLLPPFRYVGYMLLMLAYVFGAQGTNLGALLTGIILMAGLLAAAVWSLLVLRRRSGVRWLQGFVSALLIAYCLLFTVNAAYGRACQGLQFAAVSRYMNYLELGVLGLYFSLLALPRPTWRHVSLTVLGVAMLGSIWTGETSRKNMELVRNMKMLWRNCMLEVGDVDRCDQYSWVYPGPPEKTDLKDKIKYLKRHKLNLYDGSE
jgi:hypothetical protein